MARRKNKNKNKGNGSRPRQQGGGTTVLMLGNGGDGGEPKRTGGFRAIGRAVGSAAMSYKGVMSQTGVQLACEGGEVCAALLKGAMDMVASGTETKADDVAFPWVQKALGSGSRFLAAKYLSGKHPALAAVVSAFGSATNGALTLDWLRGHGLKAQIRLAEKLQAGGTP